MTSELLGFFVVGGLGVLALAIFMFGIWLGLTEVEAEERAWREELDR